MKQQQVSSLIQAACILLRHFQDTILRVRPLLSDSALGSSRPTVAQTPTQRGYSIVCWRPVVVRSSDFSVMGGGQCRALGTGDRGGSLTSWVVLCMMACRQGYGCSSHYVSCRNLVAHYQPEVMLEICLYQCQVARSLPRHSSQSYRSGRNGHHHYCDWLPLTRPLGLPLAGCCLPVLPLAGLPLAAASTVDSCSW